MMMAVDAPQFSAVYESARREWNERYGSYIARAKQWRLMAYLLAGTTVISSVSAVWAAHQAHVVPYIVERDKLGETVALHQLTEAPPPNAAQIEDQLSRWITDVRTVYTDPAAELKTVTEAYSWVDTQSDAKPQLDAWFAPNPPNIRAQKETVGVSIDSVVPISKSIWAVEWSEESRSKNGMPPAMTYWKASIQIKIIPPTDEQALKSNVNGIYVEWFQWSPRISGVARAS